MSVIDARKLFANLREVGKLVEPSFLDSPACSTATAEEVDQELRREQLRGCDRCRAPGPAYQVPCTRSRWAGLTIRDVLDEEKDVPCTKFTRQTAYDEALRGGAPLRALGVTREQVASELAIAGIDAPEFYRAVGGLSRGTTTGVLIVGVRDTELVAGAVALLLARDGIVAWWGDGAELCDDPGYGVVVPLRHWQTRPVTVLHWNPAAEQWPKSRETLVAAVHRRRSNRLRTICVLTSLPDAWKPWRDASEMTVMAAKGAAK